MATAQEKKQMMKAYIFSVGFFGGLLTSLLTYVCHFLKFIPFGPGVILQLWPFYHQTAWMKGPIGHVLAILIISLLSIAAALLYNRLLGKIETPWAGLGYGLLLWAFIFLGLNQLIPGVKNIIQLGLETNITFICLFIVYGLFIGYSISFEQKIRSQTN